MGGVDFTGIICCAALSLHGSLLRKDVGYSQLNTMLCIVHRIQGWAVLDDKAKRKEKENRKYKIDSPWWSCTTY